MNNINNFIENQKIIIEDKKIKASFLEYLKTNAEKAIKYDIIMANQEIKANKKEEIKSLEDIKLKQKVSYLNFYISMLGVYDYKLDQLTKQIKSARNCNQPLIELELEFHKLKKQRKQYTDYLTNVIDVDFGINNSIKSYPSYNVFNYLYQESVYSDIDKCQLNLSVINAYNYGYINSCYLDLKKITGIHEIIDIELQEDIKLRQQKVKKVKSRNKK